MSHKFMQNSKSKSQQDNYLFPPSPQPDLFEHLYQFCDPIKDPDARPFAFTGHSSPSAARQDRLRIELELVKEPKESWL